MLERTIEEINQDACKKRAKRIAELLGENKPADEKAKVSLEEKLILDPNSTRDHELDYDSFRHSKKATAPVKKLNVSISQQQQHQQQQQQQQQQQMQVSQNQQTRSTEPKQYKTYQGYNNLISIQPEQLDHGKKTNPTLMAELGVTYSDFRFKINKLRGTHVSQLGSIGYLTVDAAKMIGQHSTQFVSGISLDHLPDGFSLLITEGERNLPVPPPKAATTKLNMWGEIVAEVAEQSYDNREFPRLVLDYKPGLANSKPHPLTPKLEVPPAPCKVEGTPAQFNVEGGGDLFSIFRSYIRPKLVFKEVEDQKAQFKELIRQKGEGAEAFIKRMNGLINLAAQDTYQFIHIVIPNRLLPWSLEYAESRLTQLQRDNISLTHITQHILFKLMQGQNKNLADQLINKYEKLFGLFRQADFVGLWSIFYSAGCEGLKIFLEKMQEIYQIENDNTDTFFYLSNSFLAYSPNWDEFLNDGAQEVFKKITKLTPIERHWWNMLSSRHLQNCGWANLSDLFAAFEYFINEYREIGKKKLGEAAFIELPAIYPLGETGNMKVVLSRVLEVLHNARNFQEQVNNLAGINFDNNDVCYLSDHQQYTFITPKMCPNEFKSSAQHARLKENKDPDSDMKVTYEEMSEVLDKHFLDNWVYKYLGTQPFSAPYASYVDLLNDLFVTKRGALNFLADTLRNRLALIFAATTTHERGHQCDIKKNLELMLPFFSSHTHAKSKEVIERLVALMNEARWINLSEMVIIMKLFYQIDPSQHKFLHECIVEHKEDFLKHLEMYDANKTALEPKTFVAALQILAEEKEDPQLKIRLPRVLAIITRIAFPLKSADMTFQRSYVIELMEAIKQFENINGKHAANELIDILSILKIRNDKEPLPSIHQFIAAIRKMGKIQNTTVKQYVSANLPDNCTYDVTECRSIAFPKIDIADILEKLVLVARKSGVFLNQEILANPDEMLSHIVMKSRLESDKKLKWRAASEEFVKTLQKKQLIDHINKLENKDEKDNKDNKKNLKVIEAIVCDIFPPGPFQEIEDSLIPMKEYSHQAGLFVEAIKQVKIKWPADFSELLIRICGDPTDRSRKRSLKYINDFLYQISKTFSAKMPFPHEIFSLLIAHEQKHGVKPELLAVEDIFAAKNLSREHKMQLLKLNLDSAANNINASVFVKNLLGFHASFSPIFSRLLTIIEYSVGPREKIFTCTLSLLTALTEINDPKFTEKLFGLLAKHPESYFEIVQMLSDPPVFSEVLNNQLIEIKSQDEVKESLDNKELKEEKIAAPKKKSLNHMITQLIFQCCDSSEFNQSEIVSAIFQLKQEDELTLHALMAMRPPPTFKTLKMVLKNKKCKEFLDNPTHPAFGYRLLKKQFDTSRVVSAIEEIKNLKTGKPLFFSQRRKLLQQFLLINRYGYDEACPIFLRDVPNGKKELAAKDLTDDELKNLVLKCRMVFKDDKSSTVDKENARLVFLALVREAMWRETRKFPYSTQMLAVLNTMLHKGSSLLEIDTGEGKGMIMAMLAATLWFEGKAVNVCTSNLELARVAFEEFSPVFDLLGIRHSGKVITSQTRVTDYAYDGINYSDTSQLSLFIAKQKLDPYFVQHHQNDCVDLASDEADYSIYDDKTHYRYSTLLHQVDLTWIFPLLWQFIQSADFKNGKSVREDIKNARDLLEKAAPPDQQSYVKKLADRQIDTWLESAIAASWLEVDKDFVMRTETRGEGDDSYYVSFARILANSRVSEGAEWSNGVHQFLHARLNVEKRSWKPPLIPDFAIDPETAPIASMNSKNVIEHHRRVIGVTGTAGAKNELEEVAAKGFKAYRIPPHQKNQREDEPAVLAKGEHDHFTKIMDCILRHLRQKKEWPYVRYSVNPKPQPILVAFNDIDKSQRFYKFLTAELASEKYKSYRPFLRTQLLNGSKSVINGKEGNFLENEIVSKAGVAGTITVSTLMDRGTDIKPRENEDDVEQNHPYGLYAIPTFLGSERLIRQIKGRAARLGFVGQTQLILDQEEFDQVSKYNPAKEIKDQLQDFQDSLALSEKSIRRFAERLGEIKTYFLNQYIKFIKNEKNITPDLNRMWADCLNNMDIEWHRQCNKTRKEKLSENEILDDCSSGLIESACANWNLLVPYHPDFLLEDGKVIDIICSQKEKEFKDGEGEEEGISLPLEMNHVSPARDFVDQSPLHVTMATKEEKEYETIKQRIESKRLSAAYECLGQVFGMPIDGRGSLVVAFSKLIEEGYSGKPRIPFRKKLLEIFSIGDWSKSKELQEDLSKLYSSTLYLFAKQKVYEYQTEIPVIELSRQGKESLSAEAADLEALLDFLKKILLKKSAESEKEKAKMSTAEVVVDTIKSSVSALFYDPCVVTLDRLIELMDHPFTRNKVALEEAVKDAESSLLFSTSPHVLFKTKMLDDAKMLQQDKKKEEELAKGYVFP